MKCVLLTCGVLSILATVPAAWALEPLYSIDGALKDVGDEVVILRKTSRGALNRPEESVVWTVDLASGNEQTRVSSHDAIAAVPELASDIEGAQQVHSRFGETAYLEHDRLIVASPGGYLYDCDCAEIPPVEVIARPGRLFVFDATSGGVTQSIVPPPLPKAGNGVHGGFAVRSLEYDAQRDHWFEFGRAVTVSGDRAFVGPRAYSLDSGNELFELQLQGLRSYDYRFATATNGQHLLVDASWFPDRANGVSVYNFEDGTFVSTLARNSENWDNFGCTIAAHGNLAIIGAPGYTHGVTDKNGAAYLFNIETGEQLLKLTAPSRASDGSSQTGDRFGTAVAINDQYALVGAHYDTTFGHRAGAAYLFDVRTGRLANSFYPPPNESFFGREVGLSAGHVVIGAWDTAYVYAIPELSTKKLGSLMLAGLWLFRLRSASRKKIGCSYVTTSIS